MAVIMTLQSVYHNSGIFSAKDQSNNSKRQNEVKQGDAHPDIVKLVQQHPEGQLQEKLPTPSAIETPNQLLFTDKQKQQEFDTLMLTAQNEQQVNHTISADTQSKLTSVLLKGTKIATKVRLEEIRRPGSARRWRQNC